MKMESNIDLQLLNIAIQLTIQNQFNIMKYHAETAGKRVTKKDINERIETILEDFKNQ